LKIVHVLSLSAIGGVQNSFLNYYKLATRNSHFLHEICLTRKIGKDFKSSIPFNHYSLRSINGIIKLIYQIVSKNTIVHFYNSLGSRSIYFLLKILPSSKIIFHERGSAWNSDTSNHKYFFKNAEKSQKIISNSNATRQFLNKRFNIPLEKISVIYNGIEIKKNKTSAKFSKKFSVGYLGRFETQKGLPSLISTAKLLPKINFYFGGYGPWEAFLNKHSIVENNVFVVGKIKDSFSFLSKIDILVVPSIREPFGNVIVEAGLCHKAVIASYVDGIPEIINSEKVGFLIKPTEDIKHNLRPLESLNYPEQVYYPDTNKLGKPMELNSKTLAKTIQKLAEDKVLIDKMGKNLNKRVTHLFSLENYFKNLENLYSGIMN